MRNRHANPETNRKPRGRRRLRLAGALLFAAVLASVAHAQQDSPAPAAKQAASRAATHPTVSAELDRVIAVVNNQVVLASDLDAEMRLFQLLPRSNGRELEPARALERLTTRAVIEQQILLEDPHGMDVTPAELESSITELRQTLPACKQRDCESEAGWAAYLASLGLSPERVAAYWTNRIAILRFIELRFRSGIRIAPEEIEKYYKETMLPMYATPGAAPALDHVSARIQEILLQQRVNELLNEWLKSLQYQGQVEVLDPALRVAVEAATPAPKSAQPDGIATKPGGGNGGGHEPL